MASNKSKSNGSTKSSHRNRPTRPSRLATAKTPQLKNVQATGPALRTSTSTSKQDTVLTMLTQPKGTTNAHRKPDQKLLQAVVRSHAWLADLKNNRHAFIEELAEAVKIHPKVVRQAIRLAFLAPKVTSAILEGDHPERLTLRQIPKRLPLAWSACRELQTFDSVSYP